MRTYIYEVTDDVARGDGKPIKRIYIGAEPRFSHREMLSKQEQILDHITEPDCPINGAIQIAVCREMSVSSLCLARIDHFSRIEKTMTLGFSHLLEVVAWQPFDVKAFMDWLAGLWEGKWMEAGATGSEAV